MKSFRYLGVFMCVFMSVCLTCLAQNKNNKPLKNWNTIGVYMQALPKVGLSYSHLYGFNTQPYRLSFMQHSLNANFTIAKKYNVGIGHSYSIGLRKHYTVIKSRIFVALHFRSRFKRSSINHSFSFERHSEAETRYRCRFLYTFRFKPKRKISIAQFRLRPYIGFRIYYNMGGSAIRQYTTQGKYLGKHSTNGWHRIRFMTGFTFKPKKHLGFHFQIMRQQEFNTEYSNTNQMNEYDFKYDKIRRPFSNYTVIALSMRYYLKSNAVLKWERKKKRKSKKQKSKRLELDDVIEL